MGVALQKAVNRGYRHFITGLEEGFQLWAIEQLLAMKRHGAPTIEYIVPWRSSDQQELFGGDHRALFRGIDGIFYIEKSSLIESAMRCDQIMVGMSGLLITYFDAGRIKPPPLPMSWPGSRAWKSPTFITWWGKRLYAFEAG